MQESSSVLFFYTTNAANKKHIKKFYFFLSYSRKKKGRKEKYMFIKLIDRNQFINLDTFDCIHMEYEKDGMFGNGEYVIKAKRLGTPSEEANDSIEKEEVKNYEITIRVYQESEKERAEEFYNELTEAWALQIPIFPVETLYDTQEDSYEDFTETTLCMLEGDSYPKDYPYESDDELEPFSLGITLSQRDVKNFLDAIKKSEEIEFSLAGKDD